MRWEGSGWCEAREEEARGLTILESRTANDPTRLLSETVRTVTFGAEERVRAGQSELF